MPIITRSYYAICSRSISKFDKEVIIMLSITEEDEKKLDSGFLCKRVDNTVFNIDSNNIICYGEIDFNKGSEDFSTLNNMTWLDYITGLGIVVPSDYDYKNHSCYPPEGKLRYYDTVNPAIVSQYCHAALGKPKRVCIFKKHVRRT